MWRVEYLLRATVEAEQRHFWFRGFRYFTAPLLHQATDGVSDARILDCGCGTGANLDFLGQFGHAYGFDLTMAGLRYGRAAKRTRLARATVTASPFPTGAFDVVTSFDVLYSLSGPDEHAAVAEMFRLTKPGGFVVINVAAMDVLHGNHSVLSRELRRYSRESLQRLVVAAGFTIERLTYTNAVLFPPMAAVRTVQRWRGLKPEAVAQDDISVPCAPINTLLTCALWLESFWLRVFDSPFGSSLLCLARKPR
jgi:SAM-dependent methyltransferase